MKISLVSIAFNNYGRHLPTFLAFVANMNPKPTEVVIALGKNHNADIELAKLIYPPVKIIEYNKKASFGKLRNIAIRQTSSEWIWMVSIDDQPIIDAIGHFKDIADQSDADYLCSKWISRGLGEPERTHSSPTPLQLAKLVLESNKGGFIIPHSPFKRHLWEKAPYKDTDLPNYAFVLSCARNGATFTTTTKPTTIYLRRSDSHARVVLPKIKPRARKQKRIMTRGLIEYYQEKGLL